MNFHAKEPRILVVNDSLTLLNLFHDILDDGKGYDVEISNYTFEGVDTIQRLHPNLIILDFERAGRKEEWQLLTMLRMYEATATIPILLCVIPVQEFREQEDHFHKQHIRLLYKPFQKDELLEAVDQLLST